MKLTFLGTGTSTGVPSIGCDCETCLSDDPRDKRLRVSILIEHRDKKILVDTSIDFRQQALRANISHLDAVLITHCHVDHVFGLDDIRPMNFRHGAMGVYANEIAWTDLRRIFKYIFEPTHFGGGLPQLIPHTVEHNAPFCVGEDIKSRHSRSSTANCLLWLTALMIFHTRPISKPSRPTQWTAFAIWMFWF